MLKEGKTMIIENNANELYKSLIYVVDTDYDFEVNPRGKATREIIGLQFRLNNPLESLVTIKSRKLNYQFAVIEKFEYLYGKHDPERLIGYNKNMADYRGEYGYFDGNYAERFNFWLRHCYGLLKTDPDSRQAVVSIYDATARHQSKDIPCTLTLQFLIRKGKLNLLVNMRSNDLLWGTPYDVNAFCFLQEVMASWLGVELGQYIHTNGSTHIYMDPEKNYRQLIDCIKDEEVIEMKNPVFNLTFEETERYLPVFFAAEESIRKNPDHEEWKVLKGLLPRGLKEYFEILERKWIK